MRSSGCRRSTSRFALRADGFGLFFALLVAGIGALVALYSLAYLAATSPAPVRRYYAALAAFMGAMLGIALADDLILLFVFWEITSVTSFLLIGYRCEDDDAKAGALTALQVTALGGLVMSVGFLLIGQVTGTFSLSAHRRRSRRCMRGAARLAARHRGAAAGAARRIHQVGAGAVPLLAAARDGRADAGLRLPARGDDGEGRRVPARPHASRSSAARRSGRRSWSTVGDATHAARRLPGVARDRPEGDPGAHDRLDARA